MPEKDVLADLIVKLGADAGDLTKGIEQGISSLTGFSTTALGVAGVAAGALAAIGAAALAVGVEFDEAFDTIEQRTGAAGPQLDALKESFKNVFASVPVEANAAATAIADLSTRTDLAGEPLEALAVQILNLSRVTGTDVATAVDLATRTFGDWSIATENQAAALDFLFKTSQQTRTDVDKLMQTVVQFGAPLRQLGFSFEEATALIGKWNAEGVNTETILGGLRIALATFAEAGLAPADALQKTLDTITALGPGAEATGLAMEVFGKRAGADVAAAILEGRFEIDELVASLQNSQTTINATAESTDDFGETMTKLWNSLKNLVEPIGSVLVGVLSSLAAQLKKSIDFTVEMNKKTVEFLGTIGKFIGLSSEAKTSTEKLAEATGKQLNPAVEDSGKKMANAKEEATKLLTTLGKLKEKKKETASETKKLSDEERKLADAFGEMVTAEAVADEKTAALTGQTNALRIAFEGVEQPIVDIGGAMNGAVGSATALNKVLGDQIAQIEKTKIPTDALAGAFEGLGIETKELQQDKLAKLHESMRQIDQAYRDGKIPLEDYRKAQAAYAKEISQAGGATEKTNLFKDSLTQVSTVVTDLGRDLVSSFGAALNTGIKPIDDFKDAILRLVSEQVLGKLSGLLTGIIGQIPGLNSLGNALGGLFSGGTSGAAGSAGGAAGSIPGVSGGGGLGGAAAGGLSGTLNTVFSGVSAVTGVITNFQNAKMETSLNAIEHNTRFTMMFVGERADGGILGVSFRILEQLEFGNLVKATEDLRNKVWDVAIPALRAIEQHGAFIQPSLDHFGADYFGPMTESLIAIERNTRPIAAIEANTRAGSRGTAGQLGELKTAIDQNRDGIATTIARVSRGR